MLGKLRQRGVVHHHRLCAIQSNLYVGAHLRQAQLRKVCHALEAQQNDFFDARGRIKIGNSVGGTRVFANHKQIVACAAAQYIVASAPIQQVKAGAAAQTVIAAPTQQNIADRIANQSVVAVAGKGVLHSAGDGEVFSSNVAGCALIQIQGAVARDRAGVDDVTTAIGVGQGGASGGVGKLVGVDIHIFTVSRSTIQV